MNTYDIHEKNLPILEELNKINPIKHSEYKEKILIAEAKRRYKVGDVLTEVFDDHCVAKRVFSENSSVTSNQKSVWINNVDGSDFSACIFHNGKWAEIKPEEKPKIGDWVKAWNNTRGFVVGIVEDIEYISGSDEIFGLSLRGSIKELYGNFCKVTPEEIQELLFGKETP